MKVEVSRPPNFVAIAAVFPHVLTTYGVLYCWGDAIFNPDGVKITPSLAAHEEVHSIRQDGNPGPWWDKYLDDPRFRFDEEVPAHIIEYATIYKSSHRAHRRLHLKDIAGRLAGPLYGRLTSREAAIRLLKTGARTLLDPATPNPKEIFTNGE